MPAKTIRIANAVDEVVEASKRAQVDVANKAGLRIEALDDKDVAKWKLQDVMDKSKKPLDFVIEFDGQWFTISAKSGNWKHEYNAINILEDNSIKDKEKVIKGLIELKAATPQQLQALKDRNMI